MTKLTIILLLTLTAFPAKAAEIAFDSSGGGLLPELSGLEVPGSADISAPPEEEEYETSRIAGGTLVGKGEFPFLVSLRASRNKHFCGGTLIRKNWVLTAAHCLEKGDLQSIAIGLVNQSDISGVERFSIAETIIHPKRDKSAKNYDYALVRLNGESAYPPIPLNSAELPRGVKLVTAGWGTKVTGGSASSTLMKATLPVISKQECKGIFGDLVSDSMICAGYMGAGMSSCKGDSGGPLLTGSGSSWRLAGVVSFGGVGCGRYPSVFAKVSHVLNWIDQNAR